MWGRYGSGGDGLKKKNKKARSVNCKDKFENP